MKATLYRVPARNILVLEADNGRTTVEYPGTETRAHQIAQDHGAAHLTFGRVEDLIGAKKKQQAK